MRAIDLARKDLVQVFRDRRALVFLIAMPIVFTLFMGFAYQGSPTPKDPRIALGLVDRDEAGAGDEGARAAFLRALEGSEALRVERLAADTPDGEAKALVNGGKYRGVLVVPRGWQEGLEAAAASGWTAAVSRLELIADPASVEGQALYQAIRAPLGRVAGAMAAAGFAVGIADGPSAGDPADAEAARAAAFLAAIELWGEAAARGKPFRQSPVLGPGKASFAGGNPYNQSSPGMLVMFSLFGLTSSAGLLAQERRSGTLQRLRSTSMRGAAILGGHFLAIFAVVMLQTAILAVFGELALGVAYSSAPFGSALVAVALCLFTASAGLLIGSLARDAQQVTLLSLAAMFVLSALGGAWFPLEGAGKVFSAVGRATPAAWAMTGFQNILVRGQGDASALVPALALSLWGCAFFALAALRFRRAG